MIATIAPAVALAAITLFAVTGFRAIPPAPRLALDGLCFAAASCVLLGRSAGPSEAGAFWLKAVTVAWWLFGARILAIGFDFLLHPRGREGDLRLGSDLVAASIYVSTFAIVLSTVFGLSITGVLATSGVLAIVFGLALQSTLADVFAGIAVGVDAPFRLGDRVRVGDLAEGVVAGANWRSVRIHTDTEDVATIPNSVVAKAMISNFSFPTLRRAVAIEIRAPADVEPERVTPLLLEGAMLCPDILAEPKPTARLVRLGDARNTFSLHFYAPDSARIGICKDAALRHARRQLRFAGLLEPAVGDPVAAPRLRFRLLRSLEIFEALPSDQLTSLCEAAEARAWEPGEHLFAQGGADASLYAIAAGVIELTRVFEGRVETLGRLGAGAYLGEVALIGGAPHAATATALTTVHVLVISRDALAPLLTDNEALASAFEQSARRGLKRIERRVAACAAHNDDVNGRLVAYVRAMIHFGREPPPEHRAPPAASPL